MSKESLTEYVKRLIELEDEEEKYKNIINNIKKEKEKMSNGLLSYMEENNITDKDLIFGNKKIKCASQKVNENITKKLILERLTIYLKSKDHAEEATKFIYNDRNSNLKKFIKITSMNSSNYE
jgi:hypothetical protein